MTAIKKQTEKEHSNDRHSDDDTDSNSSAEPVSSKSRETNGKAKSTNATKFEPEDIDTGKHPPGVRRLVFATAVRTVTETAHPFPSYLRQLFQGKTARKFHRLPWMTEYNPEYADLVELTNKNPIRLFDCSRITTSLFNEEHDACLIDLYFYDRFITSKGIENQRWSPEKHQAAWNRFAERFTHYPENWLLRLRKNEEAFFKTNGKVAVMIKIHCICVDMKLPCAVIEEYQCPMCHAHAQKLCLSQVQLSAPVEERLNELTTLLTQIMEVDIAHLSVQISDVRNNNRNRDRRIASLEKAIQSMIQSQSKPPDASSVPSPLKTQKK
ncbi:hypothetical protein GQ600_27393 [Phytophthora cactorum]|nr:hypothetical protein GQ600_27393 [Phytophthora cactorum]